MTETEIKQMLAQGERLTLECKKAKTELPKSVWESYSAFANTIGGYILLGIDENRKETDVAKRFTIIGVDNIPKIISDLWNTINSNKVNRNILLDSDVEITTIDGKSIVCIHVPQADWRMKPVFLTSNPQSIGFSGILLAKRQNSFYCTYFLHNRNVADTKSPYPIKRLEVIRRFNQKSMVFNQSLS